MLKSYKYRLYPTPEQQVKIDNTIHACRLVYNLGLGIKINAWKEQQKNVSAFQLGLQIKGLRAEYPWIKGAISDSLKASVLAIDAAFKNFYRGGGYPNFKKKKTSGSFYCNRGTSKISKSDSLLSIPKTPNIRIVLSRDFVGEIGSVTISRTTTGKYFASILVKSEEIENVPPQKQKAIGIDLGIKDFATLSTGEKTPNPKHLRSELQRLKILQRRASRKKKGSNNRKKANQRVALLHEKIFDQRKDFLHKLSTRLINDNQVDTICIENLAVKNMVKNHNLAQSISDASWSEFIRQLEYKGRWYGKNVIKINRFYASSKTCSNCNHKYQELNLSQREWTCINCNSIHDRDINAAINIKNSGMGNSGELVEVSAIVEPMKQERFCDVKEAN